jgi:hypothetical protein
MQEAAQELAALRGEVAQRKAGGNYRKAQELRTRGEVALEPNYETYEYPVPRDGVCDLAKLAWVDLWQQAQAILRKLAAPPPVGTPGAAVVAWSQTVTAAGGILFECPTLRPEFFFLGSSRTPDRSAGVVFDQGLASVRGFLTRGSAFGLLTILEAQAPIISLGHDGQPNGIRFNHRSLASPCLPSTGRD